MSMISFWLFGLLTAVFCLLYIYDRLKIDDALRHRLGNFTLILAGLIFVAYANILSAVVLTGRADRHNPCGVVFRKEQKILVRWRVSFRRHACRL